MPTFKIASWNVNSLRVRLAHVLTWLNDVKPDVLCLQETKLLDEEFPFEALEKAGYLAVASGQKTYNGVAILCREQSTDKITAIPGFDDIQRRVLGVTLGDLRILNLYVPNGESVGSEKYQYKLNWLKGLHDYLQEEIRKYPRLIIVGDFNIAPEEIDVHDPKRWQGKVLFSEPERHALQSIMQIGLIDCFRTLHPTEKAFSWWDYRLYAITQNLGLRIDHILASQALASHCTHCYIDKAPRDWERPSDHAPIIAEFHF